MDYAKGRTTLILPWVQPFYDRFAPFAYPALRFIAGALLVPHGAQKLFTAWGADYRAAGPAGISGTATYFSNFLGMEPGILWALLSTFAEFFCGILIAVGLFTRLAALIGAIDIVMTLILVHAWRGFFVATGGFEFVLLWSITLLYLAAHGGGYLSIDRRLGREF